MVDYAIYEMIKKKIERIGKKTLHRTYIREMFTS